MMIFFGNSYLIFMFYFLIGNIFSKKKVKIVIGSHATYTIGLPLRFCLKNNGIPLVVKENEIIRLRKKYLYQTSHFKFFPEIFKNFKNNEKKDI